jgi:hypothetical protein
VIAGCAAATDGFALISAGDGLICGEPRLILDVARLVLGLNFQCSEFSLNRCQELARAVGGFILGGGLGLQNERELWS